MKKILCIGKQFRGSNAGGLFKAISRIGNLISIVDENYYINLSNKDLKVRILDKLFQSWHIKEFNKAILIEANLFKPDIVLVYKGAFVLPETLIKLKQKGYLVVNFYPDVSFKTHGKLLPKTLPLYHHVFTTKTFGLKDMDEQLGIKNASFIPHGFDVDIHRNLNLSSLNHQSYLCDVSFIGGWSIKKELLLSSIKENINNTNLKVWGPKWANANSVYLKDSIQHSAVFGDLYALAILSSKINLGILHERVHGASSGDLITSRTFHIPGTGGFMIHERTEEVLKYFKEDEEIVCFDTPEELVEKIVYYLKEENKRKEIALKGNNRAINEHSLEKRAQQVLDILSKY
jgi:spore maturation protein CgeB